MTCKNSLMVATLDNINYNLHECSQVNQLQAFRVCGSPWAYMIVKSKYIQFCDYNMSAQGMKSTYHQI